MDEHHEKMPLLDEAEVRRIVRLLAEALAPDDGRGPKVQRLMSGVTDWLDGDAWIWARTRVDPDTGRPENYDFVYGGKIDQRQFALWAERSLEVRGVPAEIGALKQRLVVDAHRHFTVALEELLPAEVWARAENQNFVRDFGFDSTLFSVKPLPLVNGGLMLSFIIVFRSNSKPAFDPRQARLAHALLSECGPLHGDALNVTVGDDIAALTPRQRTVLAALIDGLSVKETASYLNLSPHTVNDHCKTIYRHFRVTTRAELLRRFMFGAKPA